MVCHDLKSVQCAICGKEEDLPVIEGVDGSLYVKLYSIWIRIKNLKRLHIICDECVINKKLLKE